MEENAMTANGWSNMVEEELLPPTAGMTANGWSGIEDVAGFIRGRQRLAR